MKKAFSLAGAKVGKISKVKMPFEKLEKEDQTRIVERLEMETERETLLDSSSVEVSILYAQEPVSEFTKVSDTQDNSAVSSENQVEEMPAECFTCVNLVHCDLRSNLSVAREEQLRNGKSCPLVRGHLRGTDDTY
jgi:hypothetical protein